MGFALIICMTDLSDLWKGGWGQEGGLLLKKKIRVAAKKPNCNTLQR